ncbi:hypothetical protein BD779DRAFT_1679613 [Infundibulicybe gibba]|nr:hypothetical protein BD779DRAFT_1679613 [Infundibulicybe gibba]
MPKAPVINTALSHPSQPSIIMRMPVDIIREIFLQCSPLPCQLPPTSTEPRLALTHVCSAWREVAIHMPKLWVNVIVNLQHSGLRLHAAYPIISAWLSRSSPCTISLMIHPIPYQSSVFADLILPNLHRCRRLNLIPMGDEFRQLLLLPPGILSELEDIQINGAITSQADIDLFNHQGVTAFQACPKLRRARFYVCVAEAMDLRRLNFPWRQLSVLAFNRITFKVHCLDILRECVLLQECSLSISIENIDELNALSNKPLLLPSLHSLSVHLMDHQHHALFLAALHMPNLRTFRPMGQWSGFRWPPLFLKSCLWLDTLDLTATGDVSDNDLLELLHPLERLTKLCLSVFSSPSATWRQRLSSGALVPSVTSITFHCINIETFIPLVEERLVASRAAGSGITMFTSVSVDVAEPTDPRCGRELRAPQEPRGNEGGRRPTEKKSVRVNWARRRTARDADL